MQLLLDSAGRVWLVSGKPSLIRVNQSYYDGINIAQTHREVTGRVAIKITGVDLQQHFDQQAIDLATDNLYEPTIVGEGQFFNDPNENCVNAAEILGTQSLPKYIYLK